MPVSIGPSSPWPTIHRASAYRRSIRWQRSCSIARPTTCSLSRTRCVRELTLTGDHNLWVLRDGAPETDLHRGCSHQRLPAHMPESLAQDPPQTQEPGGATGHSAVPWPTRNLSVFAEVPVQKFVAAAGANSCISAMSDPARLPLTDSVLAQFGDCVAERNSRRKPFGVRPVLRLSDFLHGSVIAQRRPLFGKQRGTSDCLSSGRD